MKGNFRRAATHEQNLAEMYEVEIGDQKRAIGAYATAAEWFESDNAEAYVPLGSHLPPFLGASRRSIQDSPADQGAQVDWQTNFS